MYHFRGIYKYKKYKFVFHSIKDRTEDWSRFIDDVFVLFRGNLAVAEWYFEN